MLDREHRARCSPASRSTARFDGHANCFVETGFHKALLIDFNYEIEPVPGRFPTALGPLPLLQRVAAEPPRQAAFQSVYWHVLLPGRDIPGHRPDDAAARQAASRRGLKEDDMTATLIADETVDVDAEGFLTDPAQWDEELAEEIAREAGIAELTDRHWLVIGFMRDRYLDDRHGADDPLARQGVGRPGQGAVRALPQGAREARRQDRRHPEAARLHLGRSTR